jgi:hypothetical protein
MECSLAHDAGPVSARNPGAEFLQQEVGNQRPLVAGLRPIGDRKRAARPDENRGGPQALGPPCSEAGGRHSPNDQIYWIWFGLASITTAS